MFKYFSIIILLFTINCFEIEIFNEAIPDAPSNPFESLTKSLTKDFEGFIEELANDLENEDDRSEKLRKRKRKPYPVRKPHKHREVIETHGPGFTTVEVREVINNNLENQKNEPNTIDIEMPVPFIFVKSTNTRKNLKTIDVNPFKIFQELDKQFDSFFSQDNNLNNSVKVLNVKNVNDINASPLLDNGKLIKIISDENSQLKIKNNETNEIDILSNKVSDESSNLSDNITSNIKITNNTIEDNNSIGNISKSVEALFSSISSLFSVIKYLIYFSFLIYLLCCVKCIFGKFLEKDQENSKFNIKHSINEIEDELKSIKDKNKLY